jgi:cell division protein FtsL
VLLFDKNIDNSGVVRERDPRAHRDLGTLLVLVAALVLGLVLYAWPHFATRQTGMAAQQLQREKERLQEENRKLRLERSVLENLERVENIAQRRLGLKQPEPEQVIVVEPGARQGGNGLLARREPDPEARNR